MRPAELAQARGELVAFAAQVLAPLPRSDQRRWGETGCNAGQTLLLQTRRPSGATWTKVATTRTRFGGAYAFSARQKQTKVYRVVWDGVRESAARTVRTR